ncbi:MAG TPA: hypothetical protein VHM90_18220, partial [Phycisphaerae bacterium]|nr:hypothetical protein [Phycisphaerae bacterium]
MKHQKYSAIATLAVLFALDCSARAAIKASNSNALNDSASWVAGTFPDASQIALYNNTITTGIQNQLGASATWLGISVTDPAGFTNILPTAGATLTLGAAGINLAGSSNSMNLLIPVVLAASQTWNAAAGATLIDSGAALSLGSNTLTLSGAGSISLSGLSGIGNLNIFGTAAPLRVDLGSSTGYSGTISLSQGTLAASTSTSLPSTSVLNLSGGVVNLQGQSTTIKSLTGSGGIINNTTGALAVLTVGTTSGFRSNAQINGNISVVAGNLSLRNTASNYTGTTTINTGGFLGIWSLANAGLPSSIGAAGTSPGNLSLGGTLEYDGDNPASTNRLFFVFGAGT